MRSLRGLRVGLVLEELVGAEREALGERLRRGGRVEPGRQPSRAWWPPTTTLSALRAIGGTGAAQPVERQLVGIADPTRTAALARSRPPVGTASVSPGLALEAGLREEAESPPSSAASTTSAPGPSAPPGAGARDGNREQVGGDPVGGRGGGRERE